MPESNSDVLELQQIQLHLERGDNSPRQVDLDTLPENVTSEVLQECKYSLILMTAKLEERHLTLDNYATGDGVQLMVSTSRKDTMSINLRNTQDERAHLRQVNHHPFPDDGVEKESHSRFQRTGMGEVLGSRLGLPPTSSNLAGGWTK
ncbi:uncharacterized protein PADG_07793 [Paracoccidioides brasiliensis Pb18]|uniref:Uncharacterized protein n=1 Tax=Paracoccidioides brasiliensis (strain Pb18) TaxID=502780 RepID=C1GKK7_PARBD|nr:uncharacterized protein PADG_07793 [Paracoccidioides brasiliensis Pb18]EEH42973.2 hypothetical protein PADG_07793 [Paracoccidioides brasiliensis Pb18]